MSKILKKIDEFNNIHYLNLIKLNNDTLDLLKELYIKNELKNEHLKDIFLFKNHKYIEVNIDLIKNIKEFNNLYEIDKIGEGGQGVVYKTKNADTVIKIALNNKNPIEDKNKINIFKQKIQRLIYKPLPNDINIAKPLVVLKDEAGYVMNLLDEMYPFAKLLPQELSKSEAEKIEIPEFLKELDKRSAIYFSYYLQTGGVRKRLYTLSRLAIILFRLHSRGIVYFDISHNNIFLNKDDIPLVYLIDVDNIEYESSNTHTIYTPNFEVPEVVKGIANTTYSDIYAFGILSYLTLTTSHPFEGIGLEEADWDSDNTTKKEKWELPWIEDSNDDSNTSQNGLKGTLTITKELYQLFHQLFEEGKENRYKRPTLPIWIESLEKAASKTIKCPNCQMSYYYNFFDKCPYCQTKKPKRIIIKSYYLKDKKQQLRWEYVREIDENTKTIKLPNYLFKTFNILEIDDIFLKLEFQINNRIILSFQENDNEIYFKSNTPIRVYRKKSTIKEMEEGMKIIIKNDIDILVEIKIEQ